MLQHYVEIFISGFTDYFNYLIHEILNPSFYNYFYLLIWISIIVWVLEIIFPWRKNQSIFRRDFFLDAFYMFFNFFIFNLIIFNATTKLSSTLFNDMISGFGFENIEIISIGSLPTSVQLLLIFLLTDFVQWNIHRLLHSVPFLWKFHKVHHSVQEMGFAAHLRYHWMESVVYKTLQFIPLALIGFNTENLFVVYVFQIIIGHLNHSNLNLTYGPLKFVLNNPVMHIWHHSKNLPEGSNGINFGITLSLWDYIFKTVFIPHDGKEIELGFQNISSYPESFIKQTIFPFTKKG